MLRFRVYGFGGLGMVGLRGFCAPPSVGMMGLRPCFGGLLRGLGCLAYCYRY